MSDRQLRKDRTEETTVSISSSRYEKLLANTKELRRVKKQLKELVISLTIENISGVGNVNKRGLSWEAKLI